MKITEYVTSTGIFIDILTDLTVLTELTLFNGLNSFNSLVKLF